MDMVERVADALLAKVPAGYGMTKEEAAIYARAAIDAYEAAGREWLSSEGFSDAALAEFRKMEEDALTPSQPSP